MNMLQLTNKKTKARSLDDALVPLINIVFLLLIFFIEVGTVKPFTPIELAHPKTNIESVMESATLSLFLSEDHQLYVEDQLSTLVSLEATLADFQEKLVSINLHIAQTLTAKDLDELLVVLRKYDVKRISLITQRGENHE